MSSEIHTAIINDVRDRILSNDIYGVEKLYKSILELKKDEDYSYIDLQYLYQRIVLIAITHDNWPISDYLLNLYHDLDDVAKIGLKSTFKYAKYTVHSSCKQQYINKLGELGIA
jgi:hypothetical protein